MKKNVQSNETKFMEVPAKEQKIDFIGTKTEKVVFKGNQLATSINQKRYEKIYGMLAEYEKDLKEPIQFDISLSYMVLESLYKATEDFDTAQEAVEFFKKNIKPKNFFLLINDLSNQTMYHTSKEVYNKFLSSGKVLKALDSFYDEFAKLYDYSMFSNYSTIYLFDKLFNNKDKKYKYLENIYNAVNQKEDLKLRHVACSILNELLNEVTRNNLTDDSRNYYYYQMQTIDENWDKVIDIISKTEKDIYSIDSIYYLVKV